MTHPSGLDAVAVRVYRLRVSHPTDTIRELAERARLDPEEVTAAQAELSALGLLTVSPAGGWAAVSPDDACEELVAATEQTVLHRQIEIAATRARMHTLSGHYVEARGMRSARGDIETVHGLDSTRAVIDDLARAATERVDVIAAGGGQSEQAIRAALPSDLRVLERGCRLRVLFQDGARRHRPTVQYVRRLNAAGAQTRYLNQLPARMILYDRDCAVLPLDPARSAVGVVVVREAAVLGYLSWLYAHLWSLAADFRAARDRGHPELSTEEREVLQLLAAGRTNPAISRELGVSPRTVARLVADLMTRLGAESRFQAGVRAVECGWLS